MSKFTINQWLRQLRVGQKISFGYGLALGVAILGTTAGIVQGNYYQHQAYEQQEDALAELELINRLEIEALQVRAHRQEFIIFASQPEQLRQQYTEFLNHYDDFQQAWSEFRDSKGGTKGEEEKELSGEVEAIDKFLKTYEGVPETYIQEMDVLLQRLNLTELKPENMATVRSDVIKFGESPIVVKMDGFCEDLMELIEVIRKEYNEAEAAIAAAEMLRLQLIAGSMLISVAIAIVLVVYTSRAIALPIQILTHIAQQSIRESNFDLQVSVLTEDEVGILATSFNQLISSVKELLEQQKKQTAN